MRYRSTPILVAALLIWLLPMTATAQVTPYSQNFEGLVATDLFALGNDGWLVYGNVFDISGTVYQYGYGPEPAPNNPALPAFCNIVVGEGGDTQGAQQMSVFSDYENLDHLILNIIESNVYREWPITAAEVETRWVFEFDAKLGDLVVPSTATAFIKTLDPGAGYALTNFITADMTAIPATWNRYSLTIGIDAALEGQILQIGFLNTATNYDPSSVIYDNVKFFQVSWTDAPSADVRKMALAQNYPNPFNPTTRIEFSVAQAGFVDLTVYYLAGRRVATLQRSHLEAGEHHVDWDGRTDDGARVASGQYRYVLRTASGQIAKGMTLLK